MKFLGTILKWILIILFFPLSLIFVAYYRQKKTNETYFDDEE
jgi:preprotein translocase subunit SecG